MTILAATGGEHEEDRVVETGYELANAFDDDIEVLHVMAQDQFAELRGTETDELVLVPDADEDTGFGYNTSDSQSGYDLEDAVSNAAEVASESVSRTLPDDHGSRVTTKGRVGDPATEIVAEADRIDARYIVVGGRKLGPASKALFGSVSQSVNLNSDRPVVTLTRTE